ncbi:MAG: hypothetical protein JSU96_17585 [Acidobacteriota bacterium]|nr:MAG: hypothetical protein JSU96_17585 [Acidobacteriota bacterium]
MIQRFLLPLLLAHSFGFLPSVLHAQQAVAERAELIRPLLPGTPVPELGLVRLDGEQFPLREESRKSPLILIFYRGGW